MASACLYLFFAKPNLIVNTDLLIILGNYFSLTCKAEILYPPQFYLKRSILIQDPCSAEVCVQAFLTYSEVSPKLFEWEKIFTETLIQFNSSFFIKSSEISKKIDHYSSNFPTSMDDIQEWVQFSRSISQIFMLENWKYFLKLAETE